MGSLGLINFCVFCVLVVGLLIDNKVKSDNSYDMELFELLDALLNPQEGESMQIMSLRKLLLKEIEKELKSEIDDDNYGIAAIKYALFDPNSNPEKRNLESLARAGLWYKTPPQTEDANYKRSSMNIRKSDSIPLELLPYTSEKRGIEALARNGELHKPRNYRTMLENFDLKRNLASLAQTYNFPVSKAAGFGKRTIGSIAKNGDLPYVYGKRNIQSLARDGALGKRSTDSPAEAKRSIQSLKSQQRGKRQATEYFDNEMVYQMPPDYEDILQELAAVHPELYAVEDKRFLGSVAKSGWFRPSSYSSFSSLPEKRHVAALARLGWLPSYRSIRRFNRSGRSFLRSNGDDICKSTKSDSTDGKTKDYSYTKVSSIPLDSKRYLLQPAVDNILLRKVFRPPRMTLF
ncbi:uncharacterized protein LOC126737909 isoform X2 [Anthonomus grandis grandis]|uniref:uncharacterized protein LOC126737909 isoform X2 n=1 Tax=Anthonomus grandis grandis TaxID=2921223 RepID=UPI002165E33E|nr:uncharacterized protein LOC126737909 isoform X2 [Anthonomus grandis grandis]